MLLVVQRFCTHDEHGQPRDRPFSCNLMGEAGMALAVRSLQWVGKNMPGYEYPQKPDVLVRSLCAPAMLATTFADFFIS